MGVIDGVIGKAINKYIEKRKMRVLDGALQIYSGYTPVFTSLSGGLYEMDLTRSCIHALAEHTSKLNPVFTGKAYKSLERILQNKPNSIMTTQQFLYKTRTIYECENNVYIIPIYEDSTGMKIIGYYPVSTMGSELVKSNGVLYLKYSLGGITRAIEYERIGHLRKHYYKSEYFGESNNALSSTMELLNTQNEGIINGVKQSANIRFLAQLTNTLQSKDITAERERFMTENLSIENNSGVLLYDNKYKDIKPIDSKPFIVDDKQASLIKSNVFNYFGVNEKILQNSFTEDEWNAYYEGAIETFAVQLGQVMTSMTYTDREISQGNSILYESSRLQYASNTTKLNISTQLVDRALMNLDEARAIFNLPPLPNGKGQKYYIRREYAEVDNLDNDIVEDKTNIKTDVGDINKTEDVAEDVAGKSLNGAQTQSLIAVMGQYASGSLTLGQAVNVISISIGVTKEEAKEILEGLI